MQNPQRKQKNCFSFAPCVFWICFRGYFAVVPLDLNFTNPKSTIFEPGWKTQSLPARSDYQIASYVFFLLKKKLDRFCILCAGWTGRKYREISQKIGKNTKISVIFSAIFWNAPPTAPCVSSTRDLSVLNRYIADFADFFYRYSSLISVEFRFETAWNIADKIWFFNPWIVNIVRKSKESSL